MMKILAQYTETTPNFTQEWSLVEVMGEKLFTCFLKWNGENTVVFIRSLREMELYYPLALNALRKIQEMNSLDAKCMEASKRSREQIQEDDVPCQWWER